MTLVTDVLDRAARQCSVTAPSEWITATEDSVVELRDDFLPETVEDIQDRVDLASPMGAQTTITGDGSASYSLPAAFRRLQRDRLAVYDAYLNRPCVPIMTDGNWTAIQDIAVTGTDRFYRVTGYDGTYSIEFYSAPTSAISITVSYVSNNWIINSSSYKTGFTDSMDTILLPRRLVESGIVWRYRERKGMPYQDKYMEYEAMLARLSNDSRVRRAITYGQPKVMRWQDILPPYIPTS